MTLLWWHWLLLLIGILILIGAIYIVFRVYLFNKEVRSLQVESFRLGESIRFELSQVKLREPERKTIAEIIEEKEKRFSNVTSVSFHFVDRVEIERVVY